MSFAEASAVTSLGGGRYRGEVADGWVIAGNANGGYLLAIAARAGSMEAAGGESSSLLPVTVTGHFLAPVRPGPVTAVVAVERTGRRFATVRATLADDRRPVLALLGTFLQSIEPSSVERVDATPPDLPDPHECVLVEPTEAFPAPFMGRVELRLHPEDAEMRAGRPVMRGWFRLRDEEPIDGFALLVAVDAFPPTIFNAGLPMAWTPTIELTAHVRAAPALGWLRCTFTTRFITGGFLEEDGEVWDTTGRLVAQSRQLKLLPKS